MPYASCGEYPIYDLPGPFPFPANVPEIFISRVCSLFPAGFTVFLQLQATFGCCKVVHMWVNISNKTISESLSSNSSSMLRTLQENSKQLNERLDRAAAMMSNVGKEVGHMSEVGRRMKELQDVLRSPKLRGNIGEQVLKDLIGQVFPKNSFHLQYTFKSGEKVDAAMKSTHSGAASGKGAVYEWDGNSKVGKGRMEITDASAPSKVTIKLDFLKPMEGHDTAEFTLAPEGDSTNVTWAMRGPAPFISKVMQVFISMDSMLGKEFDTGLANMKSAAEK